MRKTWSSAFLWLSLIVLFAGCLGGGDGGTSGGGGSADTTPPTVTSSNPASGATGVGINSAISVTFSEAMDASTINATTFTVKAGSTAVPGTVSYSGNTATFTPTDNLATSTSYTATVTTGVKDLAGNQLASDYVLTFTTGTGIGITGSVTVNVAGPDGNTPIAGASVEVSDQGSPGSGTKKVTDINGFVEFNGVSPGNKQITIDAGVFKYVNTITVQGGTTTAVGTASAPIQLGNDPHSNTVHFAVVTGTFDSIDNVLTQVGIPEQVSYDNNHTGWVRYAQTDPLLGSPSELAKYNAVLINCGSDETGADNTSPLLTNLRNFVSNGGTLYASDWAYVFIEAGWPEYIDFFGDDNLAGSAREGFSGTINGTVKGPLLTALPKSTINITFDLDAWVMIDKTPEVAGKAVTVLISGPRPSGDGTEYPLMVQFPSGNGKVVYTSFHNEAQATQDMVDVLKLIALGGV